MSMNKTTSSQSGEPPPPEKKALRALLVEDSELDATLLIHFLGQSYQVQSRRVQDAAAMKEALAQESWDVVLCDNQMPGFGIVPALEILRERQLDPAFIVVSGNMGEEVAVGAMRAGAHDYIMKDNLRGWPPPSSVKSGRPPSGATASAPCAKRPGWRPSWTR